MKPEFITFTGADNTTSVDAMRDLSARYPIEWGILFSPSRQGQDPRYPGIDALELICVSGLRLAAHLCGDYARAVVDGDTTVSLPVSTAPFSRIQINHVTPDPKAISAFANHIGKPCIAQARGDAFPEDPSILWLFDTSGGRGIAPKAWPMHPGRPVGYAGGLGPGNAADAVAAIGLGATGAYWIDMESGVRTDDRFDLDLVEQVCKAIYE